MYDHLTFGLLAGQLSGGIKDFTDISSQVSSSSKVMRTSRPMLLITNVSLTKTSIKSGTTIGLGLKDILYKFKRSTAITYLEAGWQKAGLTKVPWYNVGERYHFEESFKQSAANASKIDFNITGFNPNHNPKGFTNFEFDEIISNPILHNKVRFFDDSGDFIWNGTKFIKK